MKVKIFGKRNVSFVDEKTEKELKGITLYFGGKTPDNENVSGYITDKVWISSDSELYDRLLDLDLDDEAVEAEFVYDIVPGVKKPLLTDIVIY